MPQIEQSFPSLQAFYGADRRRLRSRERDGTVDLARRFGLGELQAALRGFQNVCGRPGSLLWFLDRAAA